MVTSLIFYHWVSGAFKHYNSRRNSWKKSAMILEKLVFLPTNLGRVLKTFPNNRVSIILFIHKWKQWRHQSLIPALRHGGGRLMILARFTVIELTVNVSLCAPEYSRDECEAICLTATAWLKVDRVTSWRWFYKLLNHGMHLSIHTLLLLLLSFK